MPNLSTYLIIITKKCHLEYGRQKKPKQKQSKKKPSNKQINKTRDKNKPPCLLGLHKIGTSNEGIIF